jgi:protein-tyrosine phosphatase
MSIELWSEIRPGLFLGGTFDNSPEVNRWAPEITTDLFQTVVTLFEGAPPAREGVKELRLGFQDDEKLDVNFDALNQLVDLAWADWKHGRRVLVRCEGGWNRSGFFAALVLIKDGANAADAISELRRARSANVLNNTTFENWLLATSQ